MIVGESSTKFHAFGVTAQAIFLQGIAPDNVWVLDKQVIGYVQSGRRWGDFLHFKRNRPPKVPDSKTAYSIVSGIDVTSMSDIEWTKVVPGVYRISPEQARKNMVSFDGYVEDKEFQLLVPFRLTPTYNLLSLSPNFPYCVDSVSNQKYFKPENFDYNRQWSIFKAHNRGGVVHIEERDSGCFYRFDQGKLLSSPCMHDHVIRSENYEIYLETVMLCDVVVEEGGREYIMRIAKENLDVLKAHCSYHRKGRVCIPNNGKIRLISVREVLETVGVT